MRIPRSILLSIVALVLVALAAPIGAQSLSEARAAREEARRQRAEIAAQLDVLEASDDEVESALSDLEANYRTLSAKSYAAHQAADAARAELAATQAEIDATKAEIRRLKGAVVDRVIRAYVRPRTEMLDQVIEASDIGEASMRQVLLDQINSSEVDVIDSLRASKEDLKILEAEAEERAAQAAVRQAEADRLTAEAKSARDEQARVAAALDARISSFRSKATALARQESSLTSLINQAEAQTSFSAGPGAPGASGLIWPVSGRVTSEYGPRWGRMHYGIDVGAPGGQPIWAAQAGVVIYSGWMNGYGNVVVIDHGGGFTTVYAHQSRIASARGQAVSRGQVIGYVGSTGRSTGNHLHFETRVNGSARNPRTYLP